MLSPGSETQEENASPQEEPSEGPQRPFNCDVVDVSKGFLTRIAYKKKAKTSKLDCLLERRVKQHIIEEKQTRQVSASKPLGATPVSSCSTPALSTPVRPRSPLKPHVLAQTQLPLSEAVKVEEKSSTTQSPRAGGDGGQEDGESRSELSNISPPPISESTPKDSSSTGEDYDSPQKQKSSIPQNLEEDLVERTTGPKEISSDSSEQEGVELPSVQKTMAGGIHSSLEQQTVCIASDVIQAEHTEKAESDSVRTLSGDLDKKHCQNTSAFKCVEQNPETLRSVHLVMEKNGLGPEENQENMKGFEHDEIISDGISKPLLPQVNGNDGLESESILGNSIITSNNGALIDRLQPKMNSVGKAEEQRLVVSLKDGTQERPLVNGNLAPVIDGVEIKRQEAPILDSKVEGTKMMSDQDYKPPLKVSRLESNMDAIAANNLNTLQHNSTSVFHSEEIKRCPPVKIIRMAPSPIPSAEESSLSDDFTEENTNSESTEPFKTIITAVTTTSTTTVVSTEMRIAKVPLKTSAELTFPVVTTESSAVSTFSTMTKTTVTKLCSSGFDGQSQNSQSEIVSHEQRTTLAASKTALATDTSGKTSVSCIAVSQEDSSSTRGRVRLLRFSRTKKTRSDTALPSYRKFVTKSSHRSIFVLPYDDLKVLARRGGFREVPIFSYNAKPALDIWPYPSPRPTFGITWR